MQRVHQFGVGDYLLYTREALSSGSISLVHEIICYILERLCPAGPSVWCMRSFVIFQRGFIQRVHQFGLVIICHTLERLVQQVHKFGAVDHLLYSREALSSGSISLVCEVICYILQRLCPAGPSVWFGRSFVIFYRGFFQRVHKFGGGDHLLYSREALSSGSISLVREIICYILERLCPAGPLVWCGRSFVIFQRGFVQRVHQFGAGD